MTRPSPAESLPRLGKYELLEEIGHGGMATVYRARDVRLGREVAVKVVHKHLRGSAEVATRFAAEARAVAKLRHPNIVEVFDVADDDDAERFIVVELVAGSTLRQLLGRLGSIPAEAVAAIGLELCAALAHAHAAGIIHRDVKPENVMIEPPDGAEHYLPLVKLMDFGIAKILDAQGVTSTGQVLGSPAHMAPEQIEGAEVDARADVFGLGVLLYEGMVGHLPFEGKNPAQVLRQVLEGSFAPADRERPEVGGRWAAILARALARAPADRYPSIDALASDLRNELAALGITDAPAELAAFLRDPEGYRREQSARLIPVLTARGEQARDRGDVVGAAADFNRALAYAPHDAGLLRLIARLTARRSRVRRLKMAGLVAAGAAVVASTAAGLVIAHRALVERRSGAAERNATTRAQRGAGATTGVLAPAVPELPESPPPEASALTAPKFSEANLPRSVTPERVHPASPVEHPTVPRAVRQPSQREVSVLVRPPGALVSVDGGAAESWFQRSRLLSVGTHSFRAYVPNSRCCEELRRTEEIRPDDGTGPQVVALSLHFRSALLSVRDAPAGARLSCPLLRIDGPANQVYQLAMQELEMRVACDVEAPGAQSRSAWTTLRAGELAALPWTNP